MSEKLPRSLPCLDVQTGIKQLEGNKDLYIKLLKKFVECNQDLAEKIADRLEQNDDKKARILAHSTKGIAGSIGATELYLASAALETAIMQGEPENALHDFTILFDTVLQSITALIHDQKEKKPTPAVAKNWDPDFLFPLLEELESSLQAGDFKALQCYTNLQRYVKGTAVAEEVNRWEHHINLFDYRQVAEQLAMLRMKLRNR
uniref:Hpt domain-containing protein n=1 Tax=Candidatus Electrothrix sp. TaxID=2170559 RepID=UPI0040563E97